MARGVRVEAAVSLSLVWDPRKPVDVDDIPTIRRFLGAVRDMMQLPAGSGLTLTGNLSMLEAAVGAPLPDAVRPIRQVQREAVEQALRACGGDIARAASALGVVPRTLHRQIRKYGLLPDGEAPR
jgi:transcriptional regulator of acetoin/glycerol metabolism